jgi:hypothetical protein
MINKLLVRAGAVNGACLASQDAGLRSTAIVGSHPLRSTNSGCAPMVRMESMVLTFEQHRPHRMDGCGQPIGGGLRSRRAGINRRHAAAVKNTAPIA